MAYFNFLKAITAGYNDGGITVIGEPVYNVGQVSMNENNGEITANGYIIINSPYPVIDWSQFSSVRIFISIDPVSQDKTKKVVLPFDTGYANPTSFITSAGFSWEYKPYPSTSTNGRYIETQQLSSVSITPDNVSFGGFIDLEAGKLNMYNNAGLSIPVSGPAGSPGMSFDVHLTFAGTIEDYTPPNEQMTWEPLANGQGLLRHLDADGNEKRTIFTKAGSLWLPL